MTTTLSSLAASCATHIYFILNEMSVHNFYHPVLINSWDKLAPVIRV